MTVIFYLYIIAQIILFLALLRIIFRLTLLIVFHKQILPFVPSNKKVAKAIACLPVVQSAKVIIDLGSGTGTLLAAILKDNTTAQCYGVEQSWCLTKLTKLRFLFWKNKPSMIRGDMFTYSVRSANVIVGFWISGLMPRLLEKFVRECKTGCVIISNLFKLPSHSQILLKQTIKCSGNIIYIYEKL